MDCPAILSEVKKEGLSYFSKTCFRIEKVRYLFVGKHENWMTRGLKEHCAIGPS
jgi:hypothetical protein